MENQKSSKNPVNLVRKIHKIREFLQKTCFNSRHHAWRLFCIKLTSLEFLTIDLYIVIAIWTYFQNFGLFLVWSANYGHFGYDDRTHFSPSIPNHEWEIIIDQKNASNLTAPDIHTTPPSHTGLFGTMFFWKKKIFPKKILFLEKFFFVKLVFLKAKVVFGKKIFWEKFCCRKFFLRENFFLFEKYFGKKILIFIYL